MKVDRCNSFSSNFLILMMLWQSVVITVRLIATLPECYNSTSQDMGSNKKSHESAEVLPSHCRIFKASGCWRKNILHPEYKIISFPQLWNRLCQPSTKLGDDMKRSMVKKKLLLYMMHASRYFLGFYNTCNPWANKYLWKCFPFNPIFNHFPFSHS